MNRFGTILAVAIAMAPLTGAGDAQDPFVGEWIGQYQTKQALRGQLRLEITRDGDRYELVVISSNEHYPAEAPEEVTEVEIGGGELRWTLFFGPTRVVWSGKLKGDFIVGELTGSGKGHAGFKGYWTAVRSSARVQPGKR